MARQLPNVSEWHGPRKGLKTPFLIYPSLQYWRGRRLNHPITPNVAKNSVLGSGTTDVSK
jgi:hypothetical protein